MQPQQQKTSNNNDTAENQDGELIPVHAISSPIRTRLWNNLNNIKFKALYTCECSRLASLYGRLLSFGLAITAASSVATWALWKQHTTLWAVIIGVGQLLQLAIPHMPFLKNEREYLTMSFAFESLYLRYERLWYDLQDGTIDEINAKEQLNKLREEEVEIEKEGVRCPKIKRWIDRIGEEAESTIKLDIT